MVCQGQYLDLKNQSAKSSELLTTDVVKFLNWLLSYQLLSESSSEAKTINCLQIVTIHYEMRQANHLLFFIGRFFRQATTFFKNGFPRKHVFNWDLMKNFKDKEIIGKLKLKIRWVQ